MTSSISPTEQAVPIPQPPYGQYDADEPDGSWLRFADAVRLREAAEQLHRDRYSATFRSLPPEQQAQRTALMNLSYKVIMAAAEASLDDAVEHWIRHRAAQ